MDNAYALAALLAVIAFLSLIIIIPIMVISRVLRAGTRSVKKTIHVFKK